MPANPQNLVATVLEWEVPSANPTLRPVRNRRATTYPTDAAASRNIPLALPWYGVGGVPERQELEAGADQEVGEPLMDVAVEEDAAAAIADLSLEEPPTFAGGGLTEEEHVSRAQKSRARRKRAKEKEEPSFELPEDRAARVQQAKFNYIGASRRLRDAMLSLVLISYLIVISQVMMTPLLRSLLPVEQVRKKWQASLV